MTPLVRPLTWFHDRHAEANGFVLFCCGDKNPRQSGVMVGCGLMLKTGQSLDIRENEMAPVDRPSPFNYVHSNGREAMIDFEWGDPGDPIPKGLRITVKYSEDNIQNLHEKAIYKSFEDAKSQGIKLAANMIKEADRL